MTHVLTGATSALNQEGLPMEYYGLVGEGPWQEVLEEARWTFYQRFIAERTRDVDPRHVEAWMRVEHPTLDGLSRRQFIAEMHVALGCVLDAGAEASEALAVSFGL